MREVISQAGLVLPEEDLAVGKTWTQQGRNVSPAATLVLESTYRYEGPAQKTAPDPVKIGLEVKADLQPAEGDAKASSGKLKVRAQNSEGSFTFDNAAGHLVGSTIKQSIEIADLVKVGLGALAREMEIVQSNETTTTRKLVK
jgi:hypothetical protein